MSTEILSVASYAPEFALTNEALSRMVDTNDEWIVRRTGISERRIAIDETTSDLAEKAASKALLRSGIDVLDIDLIIAATVSPEYFTPSLACIIQGRLGIKNAAAFDISAACSGFVYALDIADTYIKSGKYKNILLITSETLSKIVDYTDRNTCILFGDGASAAVLRSGEDQGVIATHIASDGTGGDLLYSKALPVENPLEREDKTYHRFLTMSGAEVLKFATRTVPKAIDAVLQKANMQISDIDHFVLHQANLRIIDNIIDRYKLDKEKVYVNLHKYGNTSSSSIGLCLDEMLTDGIIKKGDTALLLGFGAGLTYGSAIVKL